MLTFAIQQLNCNCVIERSFYLEKIKKEDMVVDDT